MDGIVELAVLVGRLQSRIEALEKRLSDAGQPVYQTAENQEASPDSGEELSADKLFQQGINNIVGFQWPPRREDS